MESLFDHKVATEVENAVTLYFGCKRSDILQFRDTDEKKVVVFILYHFFQYDWHMIGKAYQMTYLYVPTVAEMLAYRYKCEADFKRRIDEVLYQVKVENKYSAIYGFDKSIA